MIHLNSSKAIFLIISFVLLINSANAEVSQSQTSSCEPCFKDQTRSAIESLNKLENAYVQYRWAQEKIRRAYYEPLWTARQLSLDPLSMEKRTSGGRDEKRWMKMIEQFEQESKESSNGVELSLRELEQGSEKLLACCPEKDYKECIQHDWEPIYKLAGSIRELFRPIFEYEREFQKEIVLTAGSRDGLYLEETLEAKDAHTDYYDRFESHRERKRFTHDEEVRRKLDEIRLLLNSLPLESSCCTICPRHIAES